MIPSLEIYPDLYPHLKPNGTNVLKVGSVPEINQMIFLPSSSDPKPYYQSIILSQSSLIFKPKKSNVAKLIKK